MIAILIVLALVGLLGAVAWFNWPSIAVGREEANRLRQIDRLRERALTDMDYIAERARQERILRSSRRLDQIVDDLDL